MGKTDKRLEGVMGRGKKMMGHVKGRREGVSH